MLVTGHIAGEGIEVQDVMDVVVDGRVIFESKSINKIRLKLRAS